jgi:mannitol-1-phosphate 5-dehydrogenase
MNSRILIMGAGAIGRGFLPWIIDLTQHDIVFVDKNSNIIEKLKTLKTFTTFRVKGKEYEMIQVPVAESYTLEEFSLNNQEQFLAAFFAVGPRNVEEAAKCIIGGEFPVIVCENDPESVEQVTRVIGHTNVYFAVPDVIVSNTAPNSLLSIDPLAVVTEQGEFYIQEGPKDLYGKFNYVPKAELIEIQWTPKLFLHNTPHSIAAYLGALVGEEFVHEAMNHQAISNIVEGAMIEMLQALKIQWNIPHDFLDWYANKELERFRSKLLYDPISRVAREPLRKLEKHGRLLGAAQICLSLGVLPRNIIKGIIAALLFRNEKDPDNYLSMMRDVMGTRDFNRYVLGLRPGEPLDLMLSLQSFDVGEIVNELLSIKNV